MKSIIQADRACFISGSKDNLEEHHVFYGSANRKLSEQYGLKIWLTHDWHRGSEGIHADNALDKIVKSEIQSRAMSHYEWSEDDFRKIFGRSWL